MNTVSESMRTISRTRGLSSNKSMLSVSLDKSIRYFLPIVATATAVKLMLDAFTTIKGNAK